MQIIEIAALENGAHNNQSWTGMLVPVGYAVIPDDMELPESFPFVDIEVQDGIVTAMTAKEVPEPDDTAQIIAEKKAQLAAENYKIIECFEAFMTNEEMPYDIADLHASRQILRSQINALEGSEVV